MVGLSWISSTLGKFRNRTLRFKFAQFPRYPNFACGNELRCTSCFRQLNTYRNPPNPLLGFASQGSTTLQTPQNKILGSKSHRVFYGASNGLNFEPYCVKLAHYSLHDEYSINTIKMLLQLE